MEEKKGSNVFRIALHGGTGAGKTSFLERIGEYSRSKDGKKTFLHQTFIEDENVLFNKNQSFGKNTFFHPLVYSDPILNNLRKTFPVALLSVLFGCFLFNREKSLASPLSLSLLLGAGLSCGLAWIGRMTVSKILSMLWVCSIENHLTSIRYEEELKNDSTKPLDSSLQVYHWFDRSCVDFWALTKQVGPTSLNPNLPTKLVQNTRKISCSLIFDTDMDLVWRNLRYRAVHHSRAETRIPTKVLLAIPYVVNTSNLAAKETAIWNEAWGVPVIRTSQLEGVTRNETGNIVWDQISIEILMNEIEKAVSLPRVESPEAFKLLEELRFSTIPHTW